jgi:hypothetical protein
MNRNVLILCLGVFALASACSRQQAADTSAPPADATQAPETSPYGSDTAPAPDATTPPDSTTAPDSTTSPAPGSEPGSAEPAPGTSSQDSTGAAPRS